MIEKRAKTRPIYLDNHATTPMDPEVVSLMEPYWNESFGNPHSSGHFYGWEAEEAVEVSREKVADLIGADTDEIYFTSGATEANNIAIKGVGRFYSSHRKKIITCVSEHMCVLDSAFQLEREGFEVVYLKVDHLGFVDLNELRDAIDEQTILVSIMAANNEIGILQPIEEIAKICFENKVFFHTDAAQAVGKIPINVRKMGVDLMSLTAHKVYGPMGVGALFVSKKNGVKLEPLFSGGGQEKGLRSGTLSTPLCVGFGEAMSLAKNKMNNESRFLKSSRDQMWEYFRENIDGVKLNGCLERRLPGNLNFSFEGVDGASLIAALPDLAFSTGSACTSASEEVSHVLQAIGLSNKQAESTIRIGLGRFTTSEDIQVACDRIASEVIKLRDKPTHYIAAQ